jgi:pimeloyl-ACP methyl ester carboxylesterase
VTGSEETPTARSATTRDGLRIAYQAAGAGDPALVFVHGWCCERSYFAPQFDHFAAGHTVLSLDLRGHGESDRPAPDPGTYRVESFADDVLAVAGAAGAHRPVVVGHSLGGLVALACAARPGAVRAAVLVDPAPVVSERGRSYFARSVAEVAADTDGSWRRRFVTGLFGPADTVRRRETIAGAGHAPVAIAAEAMRAMAEFDGAAALEAVRVPVLLISAGETESGLRGRGGLTFGRTVGAGHFNQLEVPDQVNPMIERFLAVNGLPGRP